MRTRNRRRPSALALFVCGLAALFYLYEFTLRVSIGVMLHQLMHDLAIEGAAIGFISSLYFYAYAPMQIPAGLLLDRYGPRLLLSVMIIVCASGALLFSFTDGILLASIARLMMGFGSAFAFVGVLLLIARWCPPHYFALIAGLTQLMGSVGAIAGEVPVHYAVYAVGWRHTMVYLAIFGFILAFILWASVRDHPRGMRDHHEGMLGKLSTWKCLKKVFKRPQTWWVSIHAFCCWTPVSIFASLWGASALQSLYFFSPALASSAIAMVWIGIACGSPFIGWLSDRIGKRKRLLVLACTIGMISTASILFLPLLTPMVFIALFFFGVGASGQSLTFAVVKENNPPAIVGTAMGFNNMAVVIGATIFQPLVGFMLRASGGIHVNGATHYAASAYREALVVMPIIYLIGIIISVWKVKETHCKPQYRTR
ncbi:MAG: MFS transporter [marine bacterium B5-7]|nr:MAG: MFS transporter [marine bacterium B5-7]